MRGYFSDEVRKVAGRTFCTPKKYVITDMKPKRHLLNYLWNEETVLVSDQFGFGSSFSVLGTRRRELDGGERLVYLRDNETGEFYSPNRNYQDLPFEEYFCEVGLGVQKIVSVYKDIRVEFTLTVPLTGRVALYRVSVENKGRSARDLSVYFVIRPQANMTGHTSYGMADFSERTGGLFYPHRAFHEDAEGCCLYVRPDSRPTAYDVCERHFKGIYNGYHDPVGLHAPGLSCRATTFEDSYLAAFQFDVRLEAGGQKQFTFAAGCADDEASCAELGARYTQPGFFEKTLQEQIDHNDAYTQTYLCDTPDAYLNTLVNVWLKRQVSLGKTWGRIYGKGFRDVMQDITAFVSFDPALARKRFLYALAHQYENGNPIRMYEPDLTYPYMDGAAWVPATLMAYLKETDDESILEEQVGYLKSDTVDSVLDHVRKGIGFLLDNRGEHGLVLWGGGDWNDSINNAGMLGRGESVWLSIATVKAIGEFCEICGHYGRIPQVCSRYRSECEKLRESIETYGFDRDHYIYGINDYGEKVGAYESPEARITLNPQTWAVLAGLKDGERQRLVMDTVEEKLRCAFGYVQCAPSYTKGTDHIGRATYFMPGLVENGSVYNHGVMFKIVADCKLGRGENAYRTFRLISYDNPDNPDSGVEPYAVSNMYIGPENPCRAGDAPMSWITGSAGWMYRALSEFILGVRAEFDGLEIDPVLPDGWTDVCISRRFRGADYLITYVRGSRRAIEMNGVQITGKRLPLAASGTVNRVLVALP